MIKYSESIDYIYLYILLFLVPLSMMDIYVKLFSNYYFFSFVY